MDYKTAKITEMVFNGICLLPRTPVRDKSAELPILA